MITILHLIPTFEGGGAERQLAMLAAEQSGRGWNVHVGIRRRGVHAQLLGTSGVVVHPLGDHRGVNPLLLAGINRLIRKIKPDVVQTWLPQMDIVGGIAALWNSVPWIVSERVSELDYGYTTLTARARPFLARHAKAVVANSSGGAAYWRKLLPLDFRIFQIANAVDVAAIRDAPCETVRYPDSSEHVKEILVVGRLGPQKAPEIVVQAVCLLPHGCNVHVSFLGEGPMRDELEASIKTAGVEDRIALLHYRADWWGLLKRASALVSMSRYEGQPNVVLEAMAAGCPLILSDIPGHREFLDEGSAILVPPDDPAALAQAIVSHLADPISARQRAERASALVDGMTMQSAADAYESIYQMVVTGSKA